MRLLGRIRKCDIVGGGESLETNFEVLKDSSTVVLDLNASTFNIAPHVLVTPTIKLFSLLLHNCNFATAMNYNVNMCVF